MNSRTTRLTADCKIRKGTIKAASLAGNRMSAPVQVFRTPSANSIFSEIAVPLHTHQHIPLDCADGKALRK